MFKLIPYHGQIQIIVGPVEDLNCMMVYSEDWTNFQVLWDMFMKNEDYEDLEANLSCTAK
jgi:hypothetical protein